jgi:hypothetical protein
MFGSTRCVAPPTHHDARLTPSPVGDFRINTVRGEHGSSTAACQARAAALGGVSSHIKHRTSAHQIHITSNIFC